MILIIHPLDVTRGMHSSVAGKCVRCLPSSLGTVSPYEPESYLGRSRPTPCVRSVPGYLLLPAGWVCPVGGRENKTSQSGRRELGNGNGSGESFQGPPATADTCAIPAFDPYAPPREPCMRLPVALVQAAGGHAASMWPQISAAPKPKKKGAIHGWTKGLLPSMDHTF